MNSDMKSKHHQKLLDVAKESIKYGLKHSTQKPIAQNNFDPELYEVRASFVTLHIKGELRGCIGTLNAHRPLIEDISGNAYSAAFNDSRFPPLNAYEFDQLHYHISILTKPEPMTFSSEQDLLDQIRPGTDGLVLIEGSIRGTFLPSVWEQLPNKNDFLKNLKLKAGFRSDYWSDKVRGERYQVESFEGN